jgi:hypothetical protein
MIALLFVAFCQAQLADFNVSLQLIQVCRVSSSSFHVCLQISGVAITVPVVIDGVVAAEFTDQLIFNTCSCTLVARLFTYRCTAAGDSTLLAANLTSVSLLVNVSPVSGSTIEFLLTRDVVGG